VKDVQEVQLLSCSLLNSSTTNSAVVRKASYV